MKFFLISDSLDTLTGFRLCGIEGVWVNEEKALHEALARVLRDKTVGIILLTENLKCMIEEEVKVMKMDKNMPIITIIPNREGLAQNQHYITNYIKESIGIKMER